MKKTKRILTTVRKLMNKQCNELIMKAKNIASRHYPINT